MFTKEYRLMIGFILGTIIGLSTCVQAAQSVKGLTEQPVLHRVISKPTVSSVKPYAEGEAIVVWKDDLSVTSVSSILKQNKIKVLKKYKKLSSKSKHSYMLISGDSSTEELISQLKKDPNVKSVTPNYRRTMMATTPNDPDFKQLWGLNNTGQKVNKTYGTDDADIDAPEAWDTSTGSSNVVVAVFDTGVDYTHEDLSANMWVNSDEAEGTIGVDDDGNGYVDDIYGYDFAGNINGDNDPDPMDIMGHGTHVSGTIGAKGDNNIGITGVNWDVKIMALKVFRPYLRSYDSDTLEAIDYVLTMKNDFGVNIVSINASYGGSCGTDFQSDPMNDAIKSLGDAGIVFVAAAANEANDNDSNPICPASYDASNLIAVAATDQNDKLASFSNYGATSVDIAAPGTNILSTLPSYFMPDDTIFSDSVENGNGNWGPSGTWEITTEKADSPTHAWSDSPDANYTNNTDSSLTYNADIDLSAYANENIGLGSCLQYSLEEGYDYVYIEASGDGGSTWTALASLTGSSDDTWKCNGVLIPENLKTAQFRMRFRLVTDDSGTDDGIYVDDIAIGAMDISDNYAYWAGTSMATPHVTGAAALLAAVYPDETVAERITRILGGVDVLSSLNGKVVTGGRLNIKNSINLGNVTNNDPIAQNDTVTVQVNQSVSINVLDNDSDPDGDALTISSVSVPAHGTAVVSGTQVIYTPESNYIGTDSFSYTISDGKGGTATASVSITVTSTESSGGGCTYNPHTKSVDLLMVLMMFMSFLYPLRRKIFR